MLKRALKHFSQNKSIYLMIVAGSICWSLTMIKSGLLYDFGAGFWGPNGHDGIWHIALSQSLARGSWGMPTFSGVGLTNYHVGFDLLLAVLHKVTFIPMVNLYFQVLPVALAILVGLSVSRFVLFWTKSKDSCFWALFFIYFGGSWGWLLSLIREGRLGGESAFWSQQSISTLVNPPFALSVAVIFFALYLLLKGVKDKNRNLLMAASFFFGILIQIKVYAGLLCLGGLLLAGIWQMAKKEGVVVLKVFTGALIISILLFSPLNKDAGSTIVFRPFWFLETMMQVSDRVYWPKFAEAMVNYRLGGNWVKGFIAYSFAFVIFILGNFGTRVVKLPKVIEWLRRFRKLDYLQVFFLSVIAAGLLLPLLFVQAGTPWNTIQFIYYSLAFSGILAGFAIPGRLKHNASFLKGKLPGVFIVLATLPTTIGTLTQYLPSRPPAMLSKEELSALSFLKDQPQGVVLTYPFDRAKSKEVEDKPPRPLYLYESTAYVSAYTEKPVYLEDEVNLDITGYDWRERRLKVEKFLKEDDQESAKDFLRRNGVTYIYWIKGQRALLGETQLGIEQIFENESVLIYKVI